MGQKGEGTRIGESYLDDAALPSPEDAMIRHFRVSRSHHVEV